MDPASITPPDLLARAARDLADVAPPASSCWWTFRDRRPASLGHVRAVAGRAGGHRVDRRGPRRRRAHGGLGTALTWRTRWGRCSRSSPAARWPLAFLYSHDYLQKRGILKGEYYVLGLFALLGIMVLVSANSLVTLYLGVELLALSLVRDGRVQPRVGRGGGIGDQVFRAGFDRFRRAALRHVDHLWRDRLARTGRDRQVGGDAGCGTDRAAVRPRVPDRRRRLQVRRRAVPHVGAGRLSRRADARDACSWDPRRRSPRSRLPSGCWPKGWADCTRAGRTCWSWSRCCRWRSATSSRSRRPTSSACSRIRRSRTSVSSCSASSPARAWATRRRSTTRSPT